MISLIVYEYMLKCLRWDSGDLMDIDNNELQLLRGIPISLDNICKLYPLTLDEISVIGNKEFNKILGYILMEDRNIELNEGLMVTSFEYMLLLSLKKMDEGIEFLNYIEMITKEKLTPYLDEESGFFYFGELSENRHLDATEFKKFKDIIKKQYFLDKEEDKKPFNPASERVRQLQEQFNKVKAQISKNNNESGLDLGDIISIVSAYTPNLNILNVWELTVYQLYHLYMRLITKDIYESEFQKYLQGEDPKKLKLEHWASKLKNKT